MARISAFQDSSLFGSKKKTLDGLAAADFRIGTVYRRVFQAYTLVI